MYLCEKEKQKNNQKNHKKEKSDSMPDNQKKKKNRKNKKKCLRVHGTIILPPRGSPGNATCCGQRILVRNSQQLVNISSPFL